jgi:hypothetical protein
MDNVMLLGAGLLLGGVFAVVVVFLLRRKGADAPVQTISVDAVAEHVRSVGKLVGLEVVAKEIATSVKGWAWLPPILLSQAKIAMIFTFEKQYYVDLARLRKSSVEQLEDGRFRVTLPPVEGSLRLSDVSPYDIQAGRILGLLDVIQMNARTQKELMAEAQSQAAELYRRSEAKYLSDARRAIGGQLETLLGLFDATIEVRWADQSEAIGEPMQVEPALRDRLTTGA